MVTQIMQFKKETKHTWVYEAVVADSAAPAVSVLYISKHSFPNGKPRQLTLSIEEVKDAN